MLQRKVANPGDRQVTQGASRGVRELELIGPVLRQDFDSELRGDVDLLVEFKASVANSRFMPKRDPGVYLEDIECYAGAVGRFIAGYGTPLFCHGYERSLCLGR